VRFGKPATECSLGNFFSQRWLSDTDAQLAADDGPGAAKLTAKLPGLPVGSSSASGALNDLDPPLNRKMLLYVRSKKMNDLQRAEDRDDAKAFEEGPAGIKRRH
jgi:hypothetical protein